MARWRGGCHPSNVKLPARRAACRPVVAKNTTERLLGEPARIYVVGRELDGRTVVDVVDARGVLAEQWDVSEGLAAALLRDATGHPPGRATVSAFADEVLAVLPDEGFAISSGEICAWLLLRAIERAA
jgi:hypothetical protein